MSNISFQYPTWYLIFCVALGLAYALILYYRDKSFPEQSAWLRWLLAGLRFTLTTLIAILLLTPLLKRAEREVKKPVVVIAQDGSESIGSEMTEEQKVAYQNSMEALRDQLSEDYDLKTYTFGSEVREGLNFEFNDKSTDISEMLSTAYDLYSNQNLGAVILATDGIYNEGSSPVYTNSSLGAPVYTIALGDTIPKRDLIVKRVFHNRIAYLGDKFSVQIDLLADNAVNSGSKLNVYKVEGGNTQLLEQQTVNINSNNFFTTKEVILDANKAGVQRYRIVFASVEGEVSTKNNSKDIFIDVLDARQKVLIVANSPHPDITALRQALTSNKNYEVDVDYITRLSTNIEGYDFVVLHQLPNRLNDASGLLNKLQENKIPHLFFAGTQTNLSRLNQVQPLITIQRSGDNTNEVQARVNTSFNLFTLSESLKSELSNFPPLVAPFGEFEATGDGEVLLYQRIGKIDTQYPLVILGERNQTKVGVFCAEGIWKWRLFDYLQHQNHDIFNEVVNKIVQYLSLKEDKRRFRVNLDKNIFDENEAVYLGAELYNKSFELVNQPDVSLVITDSQGKEYNYTFTRSSNAYQLNAGILPVGDYRFNASTLYNSENFTFNGQFSVQPIQLESYAIQADHNLLELLSQKFGGKLFFPETIQSLSDQIVNQETLKPVIYETIKTRPLINLKWLFFLILFLLSMEWFLRRYFGAY